MPKREWPRCSEAGCANAVRDVKGDYAGRREPEPDGKCSLHRIEDAEYVPPAATEDAVADEPAQLEPLDVEQVADSAQITSLRQALSEGVLNETTASLLLSNLVAGLEAIKQPFVSCPSCKKRHAVLLPDLASRANAARTIIEMLEGKAQAAAEVEWSAEQRQAEARQERLRKMLGVDLDEEIASLSAKLGVDPNSPPDPRLEEFSTEDLALFVQRAEEKTK